MILEGAKTSYVVVGPNGKGSFGVVFQAVEKDTQNVVAIKRVLQDPRYKVRNAPKFIILTVQESRTPNYEDVGSHELCTTS